MLGAQRDRTRAFLLSDNWRLRRLSLYVEANLDKPLSLSGAASICGLEKTYFSRFFQAHTGMTFSLWNRLFRIERAKTLLRNTPWKVETIAEAVGFNNITTFERNFRKHTGTRPSEYRRAGRRVPNDPKTTRNAYTSTRNAET